MRAEAAREHSDSHARRLEAAAQQGATQHEQRRRNAQADTAAAEEKVFREVQRTAELAAELEETRREVARAEAMSRKDKRCVECMGREMSRTLTPPRAVSAPARPL